MQMQVSSATNSQLTTVTTEHYVAIASAGVCDDYGQSQATTADKK